MDKKKKGQPLLPEDVGGRGLLLGAGELLQLARFVPRLRVGLKRALPGRLPFSLGAGPRGSPESLRPSSEWGGSGVRGPRGASSAAAPPSRAGVAAGAFLSPPGAGPRGSSVRPCSRRGGSGAWGPWAASAATALPSWAGAAAGARLACQHARWAPGRAPSVPGGPYQKAGRPPGGARPRRRGTAGGCSPAARPRPASLSRSSPPLGAHGPTRPATGPPAPLGLVLRPAFRARQGPR